MSLKLIILKKLIPFQILLTLKDELDFYLSFLLIFSVRDDLTNRILRLYRKIFTSYDEIYG